MTKNKTVTPRPKLEDWQWSEAETDYRLGTSAEALAERYGVSVGMIRRHMVRKGLVPWYWNGGDEDAGV